MRADDLVIAVLALNKRYEDAITCDGISDSELTRIILDKYPHQVLKEVRIKPHHMHGDSEVLTDGIYTLRVRRVIKQWVPGNYYTWDFPLTPREYFEKNIKPELTEEKVRQLEEFASSINKKIRWQLTILPVRSTVQYGTSACLTSRFETRLGNASHYDRLDVEKN